MQMHTELLERAVAAGATSVISKAIHPSALATCLDEALNGHIVHCQANTGTPARAPQALPGEHSALTSRELGILQLVAAGGTNQQIAQELWITRQTVKFHVSNIYRKLGVNNRTEACHYAHTNVMLHTPPDQATPEPARPDAVTVAPVALPISTHKRARPAGRTAQSKPRAAPGRLQEVPQT